MLKLVHYLNAVGNETREYVVIMDEELASPEDFKDDGFMVMGEFTITTCDGIDAALPQNRKLRGVWEE